MKPRVEFAEAALRDLALIFDSLADSHRAHGEQPTVAAELAGRRVRAILAAADRIAEAPHRGARHDDVMPGLRHLTLDRAIYDFVQDGEDGATVRILAIFFGGQDHQRRMRLRILRRD